MQNYTKTTKLYKRKRKRVKILKKSHYNVQNPCRKQENLIKKQVNYITTKEICHNHNLYPVSLLQKLNCNKLNHRCAQELVLTHNHTWFSLSLSLSLSCFSDNNCLNLTIYSLIFFLPYSLPNLIPFSLLSVFPLHIFFPIKFPFFHNNFTFPTLFHFISSLYTVVLKLNIIINSKASVQLIQLSVFTKTWNETWHYCKICS